MLSRAVSAIRTPIPAVGVRRLFSNTIVIDSPSEHVRVVSLNRPEQANAMNDELWMNIDKVFSDLAEDPKCRAIVLTGSGKHFSSGIDTTEFAAEFVMPKKEKEEHSRRTLRILKKIKAYQEAFNKVADCPKPVIASISAACVGGAVDLISATDIRYCSEDAFFSIKEAELGLAADVGTLQRLPKLIGNDSTLRELAFTARMFSPAEALEMGVVSRVLPNKEECLKHSIATATKIASLSPVAIQGTKRSLDYARDHSVKEGLDQIAVWSSAMIQSQDLLTSAKAMMTKQEAKYDDL